MQHREYIVTPGSRQQFRASPIATFEAIVAGFIGDGLERKDWDDSGDDGREKTSSVSALPPDLSSVGPGAERESLNALSRL